MQILEEKRTRAQLIRELHEMRSQLAAEKKQREILSRTLARLAHHELPESDNPFQLAAGAAGIGLYSHNLKTGENYWSPEFMAIYGLTPDDRIKLEDGLPATVHPEDRQRILDDLQAHLQRIRKPEFSGEHRIIHPNGDIRWVMACGRFEFDGQGQAQRICGIVMDISERKQAEEELRRSAQFPEENPSPVLRCSSEGDILYANASARKWLTTLGWQAGEALPQAVRMTVDRACGPDAAVESEITGSTGRTFSLIASQPEDEGYINLYGIDITERKQIEADRLELERRIQHIAKSESLSRMAGAVAHHFNNMLAAVLGNLEMAREDLPGRKDIAPKLIAAEQAARNAARMSQLMLAFLGKSKGQPEIIDLARICSESLDRLQAELPEGVTLEVDLPQPGPAVKIDASQLVQSLANLVTNAWEAMKRSFGVIRVAVGDVDAADILKTHCFPMEWEPNADRYACLAVTDNGRGIDAKTIGRIFDPFFTDKLNGRGLGLAVTLGSIKSFGGCITVASEPGHGSSLKVYLPLSDSVVPESPEKIVVHQKPFQKGRTVLVVEDQKMVREVAAAMLERLGFEVRTAKDGTEALEIFQTGRNQIRLVLSDLTMPRMDGWETLKALRRLNPDIPVILVSGYDQSQAMAGNHVEIPQAFLPKPYNFLNLKDAVERALGEKFV